MNSTLKIILALKLKILILLIGMGASISIDQKDEIKESEVKQHNLALEVHFLSAGISGFDAFYPESTDSDRESNQLPDTRPSREPLVDLTGLEELKLYIEL